MAIKYVPGWVALLRNRDGSRFANGSQYLYSEPHVSRQAAEDWAWAFGPDVEVLRIERNEVPEGRLVRPLQRPE